MLDSEKYSGHCIYWCLCEFQPTTQAALKIIHRILGAQASNVYKVYITHSIG